MSTALLPSRRVKLRVVRGEIPSEEATQGQRDERRRQEVGDPVEVERREGHCGDGQGQREAGSQRQEFTGRAEAEDEAESGAGEKQLVGPRVCEDERSPGSQF